VLGGVTIATVSGGIDGTPLVIALTGSATPAHVQTILRGLTYVNPTGTATADPSASESRTLHVTVSDGAATSTPALKTVTVVPTNNSPIVESLTLSLVPGLTVSGNLIARDPEEQTLSYTLVGGQTKGEPTLQVNLSGQCTVTYHNTVTDGQNDSFQVRVSDGAQSTLTTVTVQVTVPGAAAPRFTSNAPLSWRSGVIFSYTPTLTNVGTNVRFSLVPAPQVAKTRALMALNTYTFDSLTGTVTINPLTTLPDGDYLRFGILAVDTTTGESAYEPVLLKITPGGNG
jgi:hypothetical protein